MIDLYAIIRGLYDEKEKIEGAIFCLEELQKQQLGSRNSMTHGKMGPGRPRLTDDEKRLARLKRERKANDALPKIPKPIDLAKLQ